VVTSIVIEDERAMSESHQEPAAVINPFARRPLGVSLGARERLGIVVLYAALAVGVGQHLVRHLRSAPQAAAAVVAAPRPVPAACNVLAGR
jgi:hypothetical protein